MKVLQSMSKKYNRSFKHNFLIFVTLNKNHDYGYKRKNQTMAR